MSQEKRKRQKKTKGDVLIDAEFRIKAEKMIEKFMHSNDTAFEFPAVLTNVERAFIHNLAPKYSLKTKSHGFGTNRKLSLYKLVEDENFVHKSANMTLDSRTVTEIKQFLFKNPEPSQNAAQRQAKVNLNNFQPFALTCPPVIPPQSSQTDTKIVNIRKNLSIYQYRQKIMDVIDNNRIVLIQGSTGSGKTTQIPQYIMETATARNEPCRILCTQPRRISAVASAERVCYERSVQLGTTIGYQIRLDSQISATSNCIFLTPGVFLRYLMGRMPEKLFMNVTHILIDEAHERAKENDFLLTSIREHFEVNKKLKLVIMSATMDTTVFRNYFGQCEEMSIKIKQYHVEEYYLEDVLKMVDFTNQKVQELNKRYQSGQMIQASQSAFINEQFENDCEPETFDDEFKSYLDELLNNMGTHDNPENYFNEFLYLVLNEGAPINYRHSQTKMTALMIAIGLKWMEMIEKLLKMKADPNIKVELCGYEMDSFDFAEKMCGDDSRILELLRASCNDPSRNMSNDEAYNKALLNIYQDSVLKTKQNNFVVEESIDHELIVQLVQKLHLGTEKNGAILIFLPGYDDILQLSRLINETIRQDFTLFMLHSSMKTDDQKNVFRPTAHGKRKIILSTNIAESSITIDDVVYVIDSGREKQKSYDAISHSSSLRVQWISKASANQRRGRAGRLRDGIVYRIYSRDRFNSMLDVTIPELLRTSLTEVCLQTKLLIDENMKIEEFLQKCIASPSMANIRQSVKYLQKMGALDKAENLTHLGSHLVGMPIEAKYGKMLLYAIIFKCVDSILNLISILTMGDQIFMLPINPTDRFKCERWKKSVASESYSDHFLMLKIFNHWMHLKQNNQNERRFCEEHFISSYHIEQVRGIRSQILNYLYTNGLLKDNSQDLNKNSSNWSMVKAIVAAGLYPFVARVDNKRGKMYSEIDNKLTFHMSSIMYAKKEGWKQTIKNIPFEWVVFEEKNRIGRTSMLKGNTLLGNFSMCMLTGLEVKEEKYVAPPTIEDEWNDYEDSEDEKEPQDSTSYSTLKVDNFIKFFISETDSVTLTTLRNRMNKLIDRFLSEKHFKHSRTENDLVDVVANVFKNEDVKSPNVDINSLINTQSGSAPRSNDRYQAGDQKRNQFQNNRGDHRDYRNRLRGGGSGNDRQQGTSNDLMRAIENPRNNWNQGTSQQAHWNSASSSKGFFSGDNGRQKQFHPFKYFIIKMNRQKFLGNLTANTAVELDELGLKIWQYQKIKGNLQKGSRVFVILFSTATKHFLGYGEVSQISTNQPLYFQFQRTHYLPLTGLGSTKFAQDIAYPLSAPSFGFHELDAVAGNSLIRFFNSD